jgi:very-short-patch-repair endonuclease
MMDVHLRKLAAGQDDLVAAWQLTALDWSSNRIAHHAAYGAWRSIHDGVWALAQAPLTHRQRWIAAVLTAPRTYLWGPSAGACWGWREWEAGYETVVRPGSGGPRRLGGVLVRRSTTLADVTTRWHGIPIVGSARTLVDLAPHLGSNQLGRGFREAIRLRTTTANEIAHKLGGRRGTRVLADRCDRYATIPYHRCRSDAESRALEVLHDAAVPPPRVNVRVNGVEADLSWRRWKLVIEIDGGQFHLFSDEDARKEFAWRCAGYTVRRLPSDDVYHHPDRLLALVNVHRHPL